MESARGDVVRYLGRVAQAIDRLDPGTVAVVVRTLLAVHDRGGAVFVCGNGGSAATASHMAVDLAKSPPSHAGTGLRTMALADNLSVITAWANDAGYEHVFAEQVRTLGRAGDALIAISASGNSPNVLRAVGQAKSQAMVTIGLCGFGGGRLAEAVDHAIVVDSGEYGPVEDVHLILNHALATALRAALRPAALRLGAGA